LLSFGLNTPTRKVCQKFMANFLVGREVSVFLPIAAATIAATASPAIVAAAAFVAATTAGI